MNPAKKTDTKKTKGSKILAAKRNKTQQSERKAGVRDYQVLLIPVITEKSALISTQNNSVAFEVDRRASKLEIKEAVQKIFNVEVTAVRTCNYMGKVKRTKAASGRRAASKRAYVSLKQGQTIDLVEGL